MIDSSGMAQQTTYAGNWEAGFEDIRKRMINMEQKCDNPLIKEVLNKEIAKLHDTVIQTFEAFFQKFLPCGNPLPDIPGPRLDMHNDRPGGDGGGGGGEGVNNSGELAGEEHYQSGSSHLRSG